MDYLYLSIFSTLSYFGYSHFNKDYTDLNKLFNIISKSKVYTPS